MSEGIHGHSFSMYAKFSEKLTFRTPLMYTSMSAYQGVRNASFSENFAYEPSWWSIISQQDKKLISSPSNAYCPSIFSNNATILKAEFQQQKHELLKNLHVSHKLITFYGLFYVS